MPEEFEGDLAGAVFWGADLKGALFRDVELDGARITHASLVDVEIDAVVDRLVVNGVDVTEYVHERDRWYPLRSMLRPKTRTAMVDAWAALEAEWDSTIARAKQLPEDALHRSVDGEWSFVETIRHVVFAIDKWFTAPLLGDAFDPMGLPNRGSVDFPWPGLQYDLTPTATEALAVFDDRRAKFRDHLPTVDESTLEQPVDILENGPNPLLWCLHAVFEEAFWHDRYAVRDLAQLE